MLLLLLLIGCSRQIVTEPDLRSADEVAAFLRKLHKLLMHIGVNQGSLEEGAMRVGSFEE